MQSKPKRDAQRFAPYQRVVRATRRLSRDIWLDGKTVETIVYRLSKAACYGAWGLCNRAALDRLGEVHFVGLWSGKPPICRHDPHFVDLAIKLKGMTTKRNSIEPELAILKHYARYGNGK